MRLTHHLSSSLSTSAVFGLALPNAGEIGGVGATSGECFVVTLSAVLDCPKIFKVRGAKRGVRAEQGVISKTWGARSEATKRYEFWTPLARADKDALTWKCDVHGN